MIRPTALALLLMTWLTSGCNSSAKQPDVIFFLPGVAGDGLWYNSLRDGLRDGGISREIVTVSWGAPGPLFAMNFSDKNIHDAAEKKLAKILTEHQARFPQGRISLLGHSAGCGVILGSLPQLPAEVHVGRVVLLAPSVSPKYDLKSAIARCENLQVFVSDRDTTFLSWRTSNFGTYDRIKTKAAGNTGFDTTSLDADSSRRFTQHRFDPSFRGLGNDGGHFGATAREFAKQKIAPLLR